LHHFVRHPRTDFEAQVDWIQLAGCAPRIAHQIDRLELVEGLILAEYGVRLLPVGRPTGSCVKVVPLADPTVDLTAYAVTQTGRATWSRCVWCWIGCGRHRSRPPNHGDV
jgi:hypothetical protein